MTLGSRPVRPVIVLDTNVLLDWHVFRDPVATPLAEAITQGRLDWIACEPMRVEWAQVWPRSCFSRWQADATRAAAAFEPARLVDVPPRSPWRCKDPDDQVFIDLAIAHQATWLLSKDHALLQLRRRAALQGVAVMTLTQWSGTVAPGLPGV